LDDFIQWYLMILSGIDGVSSTPPTTRGASIERDQVGKQLRDAWMENPIKMHVNPVIESDFDYTGYV